MAFKEVRIDPGKEHSGLPRQPVPLRLVPLITGWSVAGLYQHLSERVDGRYEYLTAYEYLTDRKPGIVRPDEFKQMLTSASPATSLPEVIKQIPPSYFVWSDELAQAFTELIDQHVGREEAGQQGLRLNWTPALDDLDQLISQCSDFDQIMPASLKEDSQRKRGLARTDEHHQKICEAAQELLSNDSKMIPAEIAHRLLKANKALKRNGERYDQQSVTRILRGKCNIVGH